MPNEIDCMEVCEIDVPCPHGYDCEHEEAGRLNSEIEKKGKTLMEIFADDDKPKMPEINLSEVDILECLKECVHYMLESEYNHYQDWCERPWCDPTEHIYHSAEIAQRWIQEIEKNPLSLMNISTK